MTVPGSPRHPRTAAGPAKLVVRQPRLFAVMGSSIGIPPRQPPTEA